MNALHRAIIENNYEAIQAFAKDTHLVNNMNALGFTPLELAHLLGNKIAVKMLSHESQRKIQLIPRGKNEPIQLDEKDFEAYFNITYLSQLHFPSYNFLLKTLKRCPRVLSHGFMGEENRQQAKLFQHELAVGFVADVCIQWVDDEIGHGLFAASDFYEGQYVAAFTGLVRRLYRLNADHNAYCFHYPTRFASWHYTVVDAFHEGNEARFINHSDFPNLMPLCLPERNLLHIVFIAHSFIKAGSELTYDYGPNFFRRRYKKT